MAMNVADTLAFEQAVRHGQHGADDCSQRAAVLRGKAHELLPAGIEEPRMILDSRSPRADGSTCTG